MSEASHSSKFFIFTQNGEQALLTSPPPPKYKFHFFPRLSGTSFFHLPELNLFVK